VVRAVVAVSSDSGERAERANREWKLPNLRVGYGPDLRVARAGSLRLDQSRHDLDGSRGFRSLVVPGPAGSDRTLRPPA
jgi:hypothetical protein